MSSGRVACRIAVRIEMVMMLSILMMGLMSAVSPQSSITRDRKTFIADRDLLNT